VQGAHALLDDRAGELRARLRSGPGVGDPGTPWGDDPPPLRITRAGLQAIGVETEDDAPEGATPADTGATSADAGVEAVEAPAPATGGDRAATPTKRKAKASTSGCSSRGSAS
jgi:hypothetical protein